MGSRAKRIKVNASPANPGPAPARGAQVSQVFHILRASRCTLVLDQLFQSDKVGRHSILSVNQHDLFTAPPRLINRSLTSSAKWDALISRARMLSPLSMRPRRPVALTTRQWPVVWQAAAAQVEAHPTRRLRQRSGQYERTVSLSNVGFGSCHPERTTASICDALANPNCVP